MKLIMTLTSLCILSLAAGPRAFAARSELSLRGLPDNLTEGRVCKDCEARRILDDEWIKASPARRVEIAEALTRLGGKIPALDGAVNAEK